MYRRTKKAAELRTRRLEAMRRAREAARASRPLQERASDRPDPRMQIIVRRLDCGEPIEHRFDFWDTRRIDQYRVTVNDQPWKPRIGLSRSLALIRMALPRLPSPRRI